MRHLLATLPGPATLGFATFALATALATSAVLADEGYLPDDPPPAEPPPPVAEPQPRTLFDGPVAVGGWGALTTAATGINGWPANLVGIRGGVTFGHVVTIGMTAWGLTNIVPADDGITIDYSDGHVEDNVNLEFGAGAFFVQVDLLPYSVAHPHVFGAVGAGGLTYTSRRTDHWDSTQTTHNDGDGVSYGELGAGVTLNVVKWARLDLSASWRLVGDVDLSGVSESEIGGPTGSLAFRFGRF